MTDLRTTRFYQAIQNKDIPIIRDECCTYILSGKDINLKDFKTGENYMHLIADLAEKFSDPHGVSVIYILCCKGIDLDHRDNKGEAPLHRVVRKHGAFRFMVALARCGADLLLKNNDGQTAEDILLSEKPTGWQEMLHWHNKFRPGLWKAMTATEPDVALIQRLLQCWCRPRMVKSGKIVSLKCMAMCNPHYIDLFNMIEKYENTIEFVLSLLAGKSFFIKTWIKDGLMKNIDINIKDKSYQYRYPDYPDVPQPLLAAIWETNIFESVEMLMDLGVDTEVLYSNRMPEDTRKPLFFQLICGKPKPDDRIVQRILAGSNMDARNEDGQTILYEAIERDYSEIFINNLFRFGVNIASRDRFGRTARDFAEKKQKKTFMRMIDNHVISFIEQSDIKRIETLIMQSYDHVTDITDKNGKSAIEVGKMRNSPQLTEVMQKAKATRKHVDRILTAADKGDMQAVSKLLSRKYCAARDRCGRTVLHRAVLGTSWELVHHLVDEYQHILNIQDNMGRTSLHYSWLTLEGERTIKYMEQNRANCDIVDVYGHKPSFYDRSVCHPVLHEKTKREVKDFGLEVFLHETDFEKTLQVAIAGDKLGTVSQLIKELKNMGDINRYSDILFDCVDADREDIACFLMSSGMKTEIWKQYERCDPNEPMCAMGECPHLTTSLKQQAADKNRIKILTFIEELEKNSMKGDISSGNDVHEFTRYGLV